MLNGADTESHWRLIYWLQKIYPFSVSEYACPLQQTLLADKAHRALTGSCCLSSLLDGICVFPLLLLLDHVTCQPGGGGGPLTHPFNPLHTSWLKIVYCSQTKGYPAGASGQETASRCRRHRFDPWIRKTPPEEGMATRSSILAWRIPWTGEPGGLWSTGPKESDTTDET